MRMKAFGAKMGDAGVAAPAGRSAIGTARLMTQHPTGGGDAGTRRYSVDMHGAGAAKCNAAAEFGAGHTEHVAQHPEERRVGIDIDTVRGSVHDEFHDRPRSCATPRDVGAPKKLRTAFL